MFITAAAAVLAHYPETVARMVCHPVSGLPARSQWLPSIWELGQACERAMAPIREAARREAEREHTRRIVSGARNDRSPQSVARMRARIAEIFPPAPPAAQPTEESLAALGKRFAREPPVVGEGLKKLLANPR